MKSNLKFYFKLIFFNVADLPQSNTETIIDVSPLGKIH
jgi:hypothetical protein